MESHLLSPIGRQEFEAHGLAPVTTVRARACVSDPLPVPLWVMDFEIQWIVLTSFCSF